MTGHGPLPCWLASPSAKLLDHLSCFLLCPCVENDDQHTWWALHQYLLSGLINSKMGVLAVQTF